MPVPIRRGKVELRAENPKPRRKPISVKDIRAATVTDCWPGLIDLREGLPPELDMLIGWRRPPMELN